MKIEVSYLVLLQKVNGGLAQLNVGSCMAAAQLESKEDLLQRVIQGYLLIG